MTFVDRVRVEELGAGDMVLQLGEWRRVGPPLVVDSSLRYTEDGSVVMGEGSDYKVSRIAGPLLEALRHGARADPYR